MVLGSKMHREVFNPRTSVRRTRKSVVREQLWSALKRPLKQKLANHNRLRAKRPPETLYFWDSVTPLYEKTLARIEGAQLRNLEKTPGQVAEALNLPNAGIYWVDWVPPDIKKAFTLAAEKCYADRPVRSPALFTVPEAERTRARRESHALLLASAEAFAKRSLEAAISDASRTPRELLRMLVDARAANMARHALPHWPRTRPIPLDPLNCGGLSEKHIKDAMLAVSMPADADFEYVKTLVGTVIKEAQQRFAQAQAQSAKYRPPSALANVTDLDSPLPTVAQRRAMQRKRMTKQEVYQRDEALGKHIHRPVIEPRAPQDIDDLENLT